MLALWTSAWVIAEAIPTFNDLLGLISALFASWFTYGLSGVFWLFMNRGRWGQGGRKMGLVGLNLGLVCAGAVIVSASSVLPSCCYLRTSSTFSRNGAGKFVANSLTGGM